MSPTYSAPHPHVCAHVASSTSYLISVPQTLHLNVAIFCIVSQLISLAFGMLSRVPLYLMGAGRFPSPSTPASTSRCKVTSLGSIDTQYSTNLVQWFVQYLQAILSIIPSVDRRSTSLIRRRYYHYSLPYQAVDIPHKPVSCKRLHLFLPSEAVTIGGCE